MHTLAHHMGLTHISRGIGDQRQVHVARPSPGSNISPPIPQVSAIQAGDASRRGLNRAATIDFNEARTIEPGPYNNTLRGQQSTGFLGVPDSPNGFSAAQNLRAAKSFADLRSYTPSPVPSTASFPALPPNLTKFQEYGPGSAASTTPTVTPTASGSTLGQHREENIPVNGLSGLSLGGTLGSNGPNGGSPRRSRGMFPWDQDPIGSNRTFSLNYDDPSRNGAQAMPMRQPRGPATERSSGFARSRQNGHQGRGSDELRASSSVEIIVE